jgi:DNA-binding GntR family transcriptional regulator
MENKRGLRENRSQDLAKRAYAGIRQMLFFGEISPGQRLRYRDLAHRLGMSPTPVIQALRWLEFQGLVRHEVNRGYSLEPPHYEEVCEVYELREALEVSLLPRTIRRRSRRELGRLRKALEEHLEVSGEGFMKRRLLKDMEFHLTLAELSGGEIACRILRYLFDLLYLKYTAEVLFASPMASVAEDHLRIFSAVETGDLAQAQEALSAHIRTVRDHVLGVIRRGMREREMVSL